MEELVKRKNTELATGQMPELAAGVENINSYDVVFIGYPIWAMTAPPPVRSFIQSNDLTGKIIVPFCTHDGYGFGNSVDVIKKLLPRGTTITEGFEVKGSEAGGASRAIASWLEKISEQWSDTKQ
jgi:flavodoxin